MKMKEFGPPGGRQERAPPWIRQWTVLFLVIEWVLCSFIMDLNPIPWALINIFGLRLGVGLDLCLVDLLWKSALPNDRLDFE